MDHDAERLISAGKAVKIVSPNNLFSTHCGTPTRSETDSSASGGSTPAITKCQGPHECISRTAWTQCRPTGYVGRFGGAVRLVHDAYRPENDHASQKKPCAHRCGSLGADSSRGVALMMSGAGLSDLGASAAGEVAALGADARADSSLQWQGPQQAPGLFSFSLASIYRLEGRRGRSGSGATRRGRFRCSCGR